METGGGRQRSSTEVDDIVTEIENEKENDRENRTKIEG